MLWRSSNALVAEHWTCFNCTVMLSYQPYRRAQPLRAAQPEHPAQHDQPAHSSHQPRAIRVAVIGRPNVGKSTFVNAASEGSRQLLVGPEPGITRDCIDVRSCWCYYKTDTVRDAKLRFLSSGTAALSSLSTQPECAGSNARVHPTMKNCNIIQQFAQQQCSSPQQQPMCAANSPDAQAHTGCH